jgi:hypothetical protein
MHKASAPAPASPRRQAVVRGGGARTRAAPAWLLLALALAAVATVAAEDPVPELKTAYIFNFTRFVEWPEPSLGEDFVIAVVGDPAMASALRSLEAGGRTAHARRIRVRTGHMAAADAQILFIGAAAVPELGRLLRASEGRPVLLVGDSPGLARRGVAINFFLQRDVLGEGRRLRFEMNPAAVQGRGLEVSAQLYDVAEIVR